MLPCSFIARKNADVTRQGTTNRVVFLKEDRDQRRDLRSRVREYALSRAQAHVNFPASQPHVAVSLAFVSPASIMHRRKHLRQHHVSTQQHVPGLAFE